MTKNVNLDWMENPEEAVAEGWDALQTETLQKENQEIALEAQLETYKINKMIFDVLEASPRGQELMAYLRDMTVEQPSFVFSTQGMIEGQQLAVLSPEQQGMMREGQNSIYRFFRTAIENAKKGPPQAKKGN